MGRPDDVLAVGDVDLRLVPAALAVWATAAGAVVLSARGAVAAGAAVVAAVLLLVTSPAVRVLRGAGPLLLALGAVGVLLLAVGAQLAAREAGGLRALAADGERVRLTGVVRSTPRPLDAARPDEMPGTGPPRAVRLLVAVRTVEPVTGAGPEGGATRTGAAVEVVAPGSAEDLAYGTAVQVEARLSPARDPAGRAVARARTTTDLVTLAPPGGLLRVADGVRSGLRDTAADVPGDAGRLLPGVVVGDTRDLGDLTDAMRASGLTHLTAVSGMHFSLLGGLAAALTRRCGVPRRWRGLPVALVMVAFVVLVQPGASVVRAAVMGAVGLVGLGAGRPARSVPALACAVLVLLVVDPWLARDVGFVLSVVATAGITLLSGPLTRAWARRAGEGRRGVGDVLVDGRRSAREVLAATLAAPVAAQVACAPVILLLSPEVPLYGVLANVVVAPVVAPATFGGLAAAVLAPWWPEAASWCACTAGAACAWIALVARTTSGLPGSRIAWVAGAPGMVLLAVAGAAALVLVLRRRSDVAP